MPSLEKEFEIRSSKLVNINASSLELDGVNDYVNIPANSAFNFTSPGFTIECWVKPDNVSGLQNIFSKTNSTGIGGYAFRLNGNTLRLLFWEVMAYNTVNLTIQANKWQHIAVVFDSNQDIKFYKNGVFGETISGNRNPRTSSDTQNIGRAQKTGSEDYFNGGIDELRVWNVERSDEEIRNNFNKSIEADSSSLVGYWKFDEETGNTAKDSSSTGADGTLTNGASFSTDIQPFYKKEFQGRFLIYEFSDFSSTINSGLSDATLVLPRKFDNYGKGKEVDYNNIFEVYCFDKEKPEGLKIYEGYQISDKASVSGEEKITISLAGNITKLTRDYVQNSNNQFKFTYSSADISTQIKKVIDQFRAKNPLIDINYTINSIENTGVSLTFNVSTTQYLDAINGLAKLTGGGWYYYLDADNVFNFKQISTSAKHFFTFEKDIAAIDINRSIADTYNEILFASDSNGYSASDTASQIEYGRLVTTKSDNRYSNTATINTFNSEFIEANKDPFVSLTLEIIDSNYNQLGYDIESIQVGDTFSLRNYEGNDDLDGVHIITGLTYKDKTITIKSQDVTEFVERNIWEIQNQQERNNLSDGPTTY